MRRISWKHVIILVVSVWIVLGIGVSAVESHTNYSEYKEDVEEEINFR
jgi:hypothetical protein